MKLVMVHGRAQERKNPLELNKEWLDALGYGLARANAVLPTDITIEFPYYGDLLADLVERTKAPLGATVNVKGPNPDMDQGLRGEILFELALGAGISEADIQREFAGSPLERGPGNWEWVQAILRAVDRVPGLNSSVIDAFTRDVYVYLTYPAVRAQIDGLVEAALGNAPCVVLAHSLGTIIAYNILYKRKETPAYPRFVTVGSPLGIKAIKRYIERPLRSPSCIGHWFNAFDERDLVALNALDVRNFDVSPPIENKRDVKNFTENRHGIQGYLADPIVAGKIVEFLV